MLNVGKALRHMTCDGGRVVGAIVATGKTGDDNVVQADGAKNIAITVVMLMKWSIVNAVQHDLCSCHLNRKGRDPPDGVGIGL